MTRPVALLLPLLLLAGCAGPVPSGAAPDASPPAARPGGDPRQNLAALQRQIDAITDRGVIRLDAGQYEIADSLKIPANKYVTLDGGGVAQIYRTGYGAAVTITPAAGWERGRVVVRDFWAISGRIVTDGGPQIGELRVERCDFYTDAGYGIDLATGYSGPSEIIGCRFFGGGIRWQYAKGADEPHAVSGLVIDRCQVVTSRERRFGPDIHLRGCQMVSVGNVVCQGPTGGYAPGIDPDATGRTNAILVEEFGPRGGRLGPVWCEYWNLGADGPKWCDVQVRNPYKGAGGAYEMRDFEMVGVTSSNPFRPVVVSAHPDALNAITVESRGGIAPIAEGPVVIRRWLTGGLEERAKATKAPVWAWQ